MYITRVEIKNVRIIESLDWQIEEGREAGWHVFLGDNGSGKSSFLKAVALGLIGPKYSYELRQNWASWLRDRQDHGSVHLTTRFEIQRKKAPGEIDLQVAFPSPCRFGVVFSRDEEQVGLETEEQPTEGFLGYKYLNRNKDYFAASYGPFRRFSQSNKENSARDTRVRPHLSLFDDSFALIDSLAWLQELQFKKLEGDNAGATLLDHIIAFINEEAFLPNSVTLTEVSSEGVFFQDGNGNKVTVDNLSDGFRSMLSLTLDLFFQLAKKYGGNNLFVTDHRRVDCPGVVLIDEIDAHLHPTWQRRVGHWFTKHFPNIQFLVTTHSPLICQAAEHGSVWVWPRPGSGETPSRMTGVALQRLLYGDLREAMSTDVFGQDLSYSESSKKMQDQLAWLNQKELEEGLTVEEEKERGRLRAVFPTRQNIRGRL